MALPRRSLLLVLLFASSPALAPAQPPPAAPPQDGLVIVLDENQRPRIRLALPAAERPVAALPPGAADAMTELEETLHSDLEYTGMFDIQDARALSVLELTGDRQSDFDLYRSLGNEVVLLSELQMEGDRIVLEGRVYDLAGKALILGKRYRGTYDLARRMAHSFADEIVLYFAGRRGIALTNLAFTSDRDGAGVKELYLMDYDGHNQRRISGHQSLTFSPDWAASGEGLAYVSYFDGNASLHWVDRETGAKTPILSDEQMNLSPSLSPDGRRIAFSRSVNGNREIFIADRNGSNLRRITTSGGIDTNPAWSPRGDLIAFTSSRTGSPQIFVMNTDGSEVRRLTFDGKYNDGAAWHPDGSKLAFAARTADGRRFDIAILDMTTGESQRMTSGPGSHEAPTFSPDGRFIAFESSRAGGKQVYVVSLDGRVFRQLTSQGNNYGPAWSNYLQ